MTLEDLNEMEHNRIRRMIEEGVFNNFNQEEWLDLCNLLMRKYEDNEQYNQYRRIQKETYVYTSEIQNDRNILVPVVNQGFNFDENDLNNFRSKALNTQNPLIKAKFSDIVWQESSEEELEFALRAAEAYLEMSDFFINKENYRYLTRFLIRSLYLSIESGNQDILQECVKKIEIIIKKLFSLNEIRYIYDLLEAITHNYNDIEEFLDKQQQLAMIRRGARYYEQRDIVWFNRFNDLERRIL